jgi:hypothetical protein
MTPQVVADPVGSETASRPRPATLIPPLAPIRRGRKPRASVRKTSGGRFRNVAANARLPANDLAPALSPNIQLVPGVVEDPMEKGAHLIVSVNRRTDILENEYARGFITEGAYRTGREIQGTYEAALSMGSAGWTQGNRVDCTVAHELAILNKVEKAAAVTAFEKKIAAVIGMVGTRRLRRHLVEGWTYAQAAEERGQCGREATTFSAKYFRDSLETLADAFGATGRAKRNG